MECVIMALTESVWATAYIHLELRNLQEYTVDSSLLLVSPIQNDCNYFKALLTRIKPTLVVDTLHVQEK